MKYIICFILLFCFGCGSSEAAPYKVLENNSCSSNMIVNSYDAGSYKDADPISMIKDADPDIIQDAFAVQIDAGPKSITFQEQESSASLARR